MTNFINTIDTLGDNVVADSIINRSIVECKDNIVSFIGDDAFYGCYELTTIDFPAVTNIGNSAFKYCASLVTTILRNESMVSLAYKSVFDNCYHIKGITNSTYNPTGAKNGYFYVPSVLYDSYTTDSNWSTYASQFRKLEEWTVDGTVTGELDLVNRHMVRFFNSDGTLLGYQIVATGEDASYDDTPVCPEDSSIPFSGFEPSPIGVTADMDCYAQFISFATASWEKIAEISETGEAANYFNIGDKRTETTNGIEMEFVIVGFDADCISTNKIAGMTIVANTPLSNATTPVGSKFGGTYANSDIATKVNNYRDLLGSDLHDVIKNTRKKYKNTSGGVDYIDQYCWLLSLDEIMENTEDNINESYLNAPYPGFVNDQTLINFTGRYWTRSMVDNYKYFWAIDDFDSKLHGYYTNGNLIRFGFCI